MKVRVRVRISAGVRVRVGVRAGVDGEVRGLNGYLAHKKTPSPLGPP